MRVRVVVALLILLASASTSGQFGQQTPPRQRRATYALADGRTLEGMPLNHNAADDIQLRGEDGRIFLLRKSGTENGKPLWHFQTNSVWRASPMAYVFDGQQRVAIASGSNIIVLGLME